MLKSHQMSPNRGESCIDSPDLIKKTEKQQKNPSIKYFQYAAIAALNHEEIGKNPEKIT